MITLLGSRALGATNLTNTTLLSWLAYGYRCHSMPHQLEGFKIASYFKISEKRLVMAVIVAIVVGAFLSIGLHISLSLQISIRPVGSRGVSLSAESNRLPTSAEF